MSGAGRSSRTLLGGLDVSTFLERHWHKQPLLVRGAIPDFECPITPEELAGLACDEDVTSRLVLERGGERPWQVRHGPFEESDFTALAQDGWSLMVQEVDQLVPGVADLLSAFRFVPNWRIDDVMVSYAPPGASVGAHVDSYDVFLFQGLGRRRWQIMTEPVVHEKLVPDQDVRMLQDFKSDQEWELAAGDMLYLPPKVAHHGIAIDASMTLSIGFSAPEAGELFAAFVTSAIEGALDVDDNDPEADSLSRAVNRRYADPDMTETVLPGEITPEARRRLHTMVRDVIDNEEAFDRWLGSFLTAPRRIAPRASEEPLGDLTQALSAGAVLLRNAVPQFAHLHSDGATYLYVGGREYRCSTELAALISGTADLNQETLQPHLAQPSTHALLTELIQQGHLEVQAGGG